MARRATTTRGPAMAECASEVAKWTGWHLSLKFVGGIPPRSMLDEHTPWTAVGATREQLMRSKVPCGWSGP
jgi:hypothetical protein